MENFDKGAFVLGVVIGLALLHWRKLLPLIRRKGYVHPLIKARLRRIGIEEAQRESRKHDHRYRTHSWYAWYPVAVFDWNESRWITCWLMDVKRRLSGHPPKWEYWID